MEAEEKYQQELVQSEKDHHSPTAGAMVGHVLANLIIHQIKLRQIVYYLKGRHRTFVQETFPKIITDENQLLDQLNYLMLDEGEVIPTTTEELTHYSMLEEKGCLKYEVGEVLLEQVVKDFDTQLLFINKGITLAETENKFGIVGFLKKLYIFMKHQIFVIQSYLGHEISERLEEDEDE